MAEADLTELNFVQERFHSFGRSIVSGKHAYLGVDVSNPPYLPNLLNAVAKFKHLQKIDISNFVADDVEVLKDMKCIKELILRGNCMRSLDSFTGKRGHCVGAVSMEVLDVSFNKLTGMPERLGLTYLRSLNLSHNTISNFRGLVGLKFLAILDLSHNQIRSTQELSQVSRSLRQLYLNDNNISTLDESFTQCTQLKILNLANNKISSIENLKLCTSLCSLNLSKNYLYGIRQIEYLVGLPTLKKLDLADNFMTAAVDYEYRVIHRLGPLTFLDGVEISSPDRVKAANLYGGVELENRRLTHSKFIQEFPMYNPFRVWTEKRSPPQMLHYDSRTLDSGTTVVFELWDEGEDWSMDSGDKAREGLVVHAHTVDGDNLKPLYILDHFRDFGLILQFVTIPPTDQPELSDDEDSDDDSVDIDTSLLSPVPVPKPAFQLHRVSNKFSDGVLRLYFAENAHFSINRKGIVRTYLTAEDAEAKADTSIEGIDMTVTYCNGEYRAKFFMPPTSAYKWYQEINITLPEKSVLDAQAKKGDSYDNIVERRYNSALHLFHHLLLADKQTPQLMQETARLKPTMKEQWQGEWDKFKQQKADPLWHGASPHTLLLRHLTDLIGEGTTLTKQSNSILFPLCGKSVDMLHLQQLGFFVVGVDIVPDALAQFRAATSDKLKWLEPQPDRSGVRHAVSQKKKMNRKTNTLSSVNPMELLEGDFFKLEALDDQEAQFDYIFDRAGISFVPPSLYPRYVGRVQRLLKPGGRMLLVVFEFDENQLDGSGPPHALTQQDVEKLFGDDFTIKHLSRENITDTDTRWRNRGFEELHESAYLLIRNNY